MADNVYDAIVIGSGISGGWAAKELCEKGLKTIMLERGRNIEHVVDHVKCENKEVIGLSPSWTPNAGNDQSVPCIKKRLSTQRNKSGLLGE